MPQRLSIRVVVMSLGSLAVTGWALHGCSGPQPLSQAIRPADDSAYSLALDEHNGSPVQAYLALRASELGLTEDQALDRDRGLSTTQNPFRARKDPSAVSRGAVVYQRHCADCHGLNADGRGAELTQPLADADFHDFSHRFAVTLHGGAPRSWFKKITEGYTSDEPDSDGNPQQMPAFEDTLAREQIWLAITYLQSLDADITPRSEAEDH